MPIAGTCAGRFTRQQLGSPFIKALKCQFTQGYGFMNSHTVMAGRWNEVWLSVYIIIKATITSSVRQIWPQQPTVSHISTMARNFMVRARGAGERRTNAFPD